MSEFINLNKFTKLEKIGKEEFGKVFKVIENDTQKVFASKISKAELTEEDLEFFTDINNEVKILSQLNHKLVLKFIGYSPSNFDQNPYPVIITEYSPNKSLYSVEIAL